MDLILDQRLKETRTVLKISPSGLPNHSIYEDMQAKSHGSVVSLIIYLYH